MRDRAFFHRLRVETKLINLNPIEYEHSSCLNNASDARVLSS